MVVDISDKTIKRYQSLRLKEKASPKTINEEVGFLLRLLEDRGDAIRSKMRRDKTLKLRAGVGKGKAFDPAQKSALLEYATVRLGSGRTGTRSPFIKPAAELAFNTGMRNAEIRTLTWDQIDFDKRILTVGRSKSDAGTGRTIPLNTDLYSALKDHSEWYSHRFGQCKSEWYVFPARIKEGNKRPYDPTSYRHPQDLLEEREEEGRS
jgi:integrase